MPIYLRHATFKDLNSIIEIVNQAKEFLKNYGSPQWQDGHPTIKMLEDDIRQHNSWVLIIDNKVAGTAVLETKQDFHYDNITNGHWNKPNESYTIIHRVAISNNFRGKNLGKFLFATLLSVGYAQGIRNFRYDTHPINIPMKKIGESMGFTRRGIIYVDDKIDTKRIAYELNL